MSTIPVSDFSNNSRSLYQEILQSPVPAQSNNGTLDISVSELMKTSSSNSRIRKISKSNNENAAMEQSAEEGPSAAKKLDHNAKERIRRMKLNASYLALRALLPDSRRSKKRWSAPAIVDRVLKYIPELENEIETLRSHKENMQSEEKNKKIAKENPSSEYQSRTVTLNQVNEEEAVIQICMAKEDELNFTNLLQSIEDEDICIKSASTLYICENRICCHLYIQINSTSKAASSIEELREKAISWLT